jgi:glycine betaine/proline transport system substrate-binding protein
MRLSRLLFGIFLSIPLLFPFDTALYQTVDKTEAAQTEQERTIRMGRATWDTGWFQGEVFKQLFEALGYTVVGPDTYDNEDFYQAVAQGDVDLWVNGWFPLHDPFIKAEQIQDQVEVLGFEVKAGALQGYLIDKNTAEQYNIQSLADLQKPEVAQLFDSDGNGQADLIGCNPGWGCEPIIEHHLDVYQLRQTVEHVQGDYSPLMGETVERYQQGEPVLFYTWTPNWTVGALVPGQDVVWLEVPFPSLPDAETDLEAQTTVANLPGCVADPCQVGFPPNDIRAVANINFLTANPAVRHILETVVLPLEDISAQNALLLEGEDDENDIRHHATEWIDNNREIVDRWLAAAREIQGDNQGLVSPDATGSNETQSGTGEVLRVATKTVPPFVIYKDRQ